MNNLRHSTILAQGPKQWENWRKANAGIRPDLAGAVLSGIELRGIDLSSADLRGASIAGADLRRANLTGALCTGADLSGAILIDSILVGVFFTGAFLGGADLSNADLREANLSGADLSGAKLSGAILRCSAFKESPRGDTTRPRTTMLTFCLLRGAVLTWCDLRGVDCSGARLYGADLSDTLLRSANLSGADLRGANLSRSDVSGANLYDANLTGANLTDANMSGADLRCARLSGAKLRGALLRKTSLRGVDCSDADFTNAVFFETDLAGAVLDRAAVGGVSSRDCTFDAASSQANLIVSPSGESALLIDTLEAAEFVHFLLAAPGVRDTVIHSISGNFVLLFGSFEEKRELLDAIAGELRQRGYPPLVADSDRIVNKNYRDRLRQLAPLCQFAIGELSSPTPFPADALAIFYDGRIPLLPLVPESQVVPAALNEFGTQISRIPPLIYRGFEDLKADFEKKVLEPVERKRKQMKELLHNSEYLL